MPGSSLVFCLSFPPTANECSLTWIKNNRRSHPRLEHTAVPWGCAVRVLVSHAQFPVRPVSFNAFSLYALFRRIIYVHSLYIAVYIVCFFYIFVPCFLSPPLHREAPTLFWHEKKSVAKRVESRVIHNGDYVVASRPFSEESYHEITATLLLFHGRWPNSISAADHYQYHSTFLSIYPQRTAGWIAPLHPGEVSLPPSYCCVLIFCCSSFSNFFEFFMEKRARFHYLKKKKRVLSAKMTCPRLFTSVAMIKLILSFSFLRKRDPRILHN